MGHDSLRHDNQCENCGYTVAVAYCTRCGQKNTETRQSFAHLVGHFAEDLTHYDSGFWKTLKYLLFRPAKLTTEYLSGKTQSYVPPVKLYIFISFITFFILAILPDFDDETENLHTKESEKEVSAPVVVPRLDVKESLWKWDFSDDTSLMNPLTYTSVKQMDSIEALKPENLRLNSFEYKIAKRIIHMREHYTTEQLNKKYDEAVSHNVPKALFLYMPIFAFWLWLFHGKKRWYFFDHGIFTLHYFSFLLIVVTAYTVLGNILYGLGLSSTVIALATLPVLFWMSYYFYRAHRKFYQEKWIVNSLKSTILFFINVICILFTLVVFTRITFYTLH